MWLCLIHVGNVMCGEYGERLVRSKFIGINFVFVYNKSQWKVIKNSKPNERNLYNL